jgi:uncharacterized protein
MRHWTAYLLGAFVFSAVWALEACGEDVMTAKKVSELGQPALHLQLQGETGKRLDAVIDNWLLTTPDANPGILEMFRLRDRKSPYEGQTPWEGFLGLMPWAGEFVGKYLVSAVEARRMTANPALDAVIRRTVAELIATQAEDGYLGPFPKDQRLLGQWDLWGHYHVLLGLYLWHLDTGDRPALDAALRAADLVCTTYLDTSRRVHDAGSQEMNMAIMHVLGILHRETGKPEYLRMAKEILKDWEKPPAGDYYRLALKGVEFYQTPKPRWESLHPILGLAELYRITGDETYKQAFLHMWRSIYRTDIHNAGSFSTNEGAVGNPFMPGSIETCCTVAWMALSVEALRLSGDSRAADALESATWNTVLGYEHPSGRWCTYDTPMNGKRAASAHAIVFQARPGTPELNCCSVNGPRGLSIISEWAVLGDGNDVYLNYYGPGTIEADFGPRGRWTIAQETAYPVEGRIRIQLNPPGPVESTVHVRIPAWSKQTRLAVNGADVAGVEAGRYCDLRRAWKPGDIVELTLDMKPRALRGDNHVNFDTSLFHGPLLLAFDQKHNAIEPADVPALDLQALELVPATCDDRFQPIVLYKARAVDGRDLYLTDYATAGAHGTFYRSWLPVNHAPLAPFLLAYPRNDETVPDTEVELSWGAAGPNATYDIAIAEDEALSHVVFRQEGITATEATITPKLAPKQTYYWQATARGDGETAASVSGPGRFRIDPDLAQTVRGVVVQAPLAGTAEPAQGKLLVNTGTAPAADSTGAEGKALSFDGATSRLVYDAPMFPVRNFTFSAWFCPKDLTAEDKGWHHICSAWNQGGNDPIRLSVVAKQLVVRIEQPSGLYGTEGVPVENGQWTHVAMVKRRDTLTLYVNGKPVRKTTIPRALAPGATNLGIGCNPNYSQVEAFHGAIRGVQFTREALDEAAVQRLCQ